MIELDLSYLHARKLLLPAYEQINLVLVGCGGTGSFMARGVATVARLLIDKFRKSVAVYFFDPDTVEEKNCYRQNFSPAEIGRNKAETLAFRFGCAWGLEIAAVPAPFSAQGILYGGLKDWLTVLVGCVDNAAARKEIRKACPPSNSSSARTWWLDCGNHQSSGQVLLGCGVEKPKKDPFELPGFCSWLPLPTERHPELLEVEPDDSNTVDTSRMSCADLAMLDSQGLAINQRVAAEATDYLVRMLLTRDLQKTATYLNLAAGSSRSVYITSE
jgi:PRTRC genetic system ThiF family protein